MDLRTQQLNILMETIRDIVKVKSCPDWVSRRLSAAVKKAKDLQTVQNTDTAPEYEIVNEYRPFTIDEYAISNIKGDTCLYKITEQSDPINGVNLYTVRIEKGNDKNPTGYTVYNVPETMLQHIKFKQ